MGDTRQELEAPELRPDDTFLLGGAESEVPHGDRNVEDIHRQLLFENFLKEAEDVAVDRPEDERVADPAEPERRAIRVLFGFTVARGHVDEYDRLLAKQRIKQVNEATARFERVLHTYEMNPRPAEHGRAPRLHAHSRVRVLAVRKDEHRRGQPTDEYVGEQCEEDDERDGEKVERHDWVSSPGLG